MDNQLLLNNEIEFWLEYIQRWQDIKSEPVPERARQALGYARSKQRSLMTQFDDGQETVDATPTIH